MLEHMTLHVRAAIGEHGWCATLAEWGDDASSDGFRLYTRRAGDVPADAAWDDIAQNYLSYPDAAGACDVLEAEVAFRNHNPQWRRLRVGVPA
jgi:hypothetical protein